MNFKILFLALFLFAGCSGRPAGSPCSDAIGGDCASHVCTNGFCKSRRHTAGEVLLIGLAGGLFGAMVVNAIMKRP